MNELPFLAWSYIYSSGSICSDIVETEYPKTCAINSIKYNMDLKCPD